MSTKIIVSIFCFIFINTLLAQNDIKLIFKIREDSILLRWAPSTIPIWKEGNDKGYKLELYKVDISKQKSSTKLISETFFKPKEVDQWATVKEDTMAMVAANAIFNKYQGHNKIEQYNLDKMNYSMALFAADVSKNAAIYSGLFTSLENSLQEYPLLLKMYIPNSLVSRDTAILFLDNKINRTEYPELPKITLLEERNQVVLQVNVDGFEKFFSYYNIECSYDNIHFFKINKNRHVADNRNKQLVFKDSIRKDTTYYRFLPVDYFYELQKSTPAYRFVRDNIKEFVIINHQLVDNGVVFHLNYSFQDTDSLQLNYYSSPKSSVAKTLSYEVVDSSLKVNFYNAGYYSVVSRNKSSPFYYVEIEDTIPPSLDNKQIYISINKYKAVLKWGKYDDVKYVNVYIRNNSHHNWTLQNITPIKDTFYVFRVPDAYIDTITIGVTFSDIRYNESELLIYHVFLKDTIPPVEAVLDYYKIRKDTIELKWFYSSSYDYHSQQLLLVSVNDTFTYHLNKHDTFYLGRLPDDIHQFLCFLESKDNSANKSYSKQLPISRQVSQVFLGPKFLKIQHAQEYNKLIWEENRNVKYIHIYRYDDSTYVWIKTLPSGETSYVDYKIFGGDRYFLVAESFSGALSNKIYVE